MGRLKPLMIAALAALVIAASACEPADDSDLLSPENDIIITSPSP